MNIVKMETKHVKNIAILEIELQQKSAWSEQQIISSINSEHQCNFVIITNDIMIGYIVCAYVLDEAEIHIIGIRGSYQQKGYASNLLTHLLTNLPNKVDKLFLEVRESNLAAIYLYQKNGFEKVGVRKSYYSTQNAKENALVLRKNLEEM